MRVSALQMHSVTVMQFQAETHSHTSRFIYFHFTFNAVTKLLFMGANTNPYSKHIESTFEKHTENESRPNLNYHINPFHATLTTTYVKHTCKMYSWKVVEECEETAKRG